MIRHSSQKRKRSPRPSPDERRAKRVKRRVCGNEDCDTKTVYNVLADTCVHMDSKRRMIADDDVLCILKANVDEYAGSPQQSSETEPTCADWGKLSIRNNLVQTVTWLLDRGILKKGGDPEHVQGFLCIAFVYESTETIDVMLQAGEAYDYQRNEKSTFRDTDFSSSSSSHDDGWYIDCTINLLDLAIMQIQTEETNLLLEYGFPCFPSFDIIAKSYLLFPGVPDTIASRDTMYRAIIHHFSSARHLWRPKYHRNWGTFAQPEVIRILLLLQASTDTIVSVLPPELLHLIIQYWLERVTLHKDFGVTLWLMQQYLEGNGEKAFRTLFQI